MKKTLFLFLLLLSVFPAASDAESRRFMWVTRWDYHSPEDIQIIMQNLKSIGTSDVFFQVRGNATVLYDSEIEPWSGEISGDEKLYFGRNPGWDPLKTAISEAHRNGLRIHAWMNVFPAWRGTFSPPPNSNHPWIKHRNWFMTDQKGVLLKPTDKGYTFLSPGIPEVRSYLAGVFGEVAKKYPLLDGIHLDYVRYPIYKEYGSFRDFSYDQTSTQLYKKKYGKFPNTNQPEWAEFKQNNVTETIRMIRAAINKYAPTIQLSSTFMAEIQTAYTQAGQNPMKWLSDNLVDWVVPMAYKHTASEFENILALLDHYIGPAWPEKMVIGINADFNSPAQIQEQMNYALLEKKRWTGYVCLLHRFYRSQTE